MKSRMELKSSDREIFGKVISVLSDNGFVCITEAMEALSEHRAKEGLAPKQLGDILKTVSFQEKLVEILKEMANRKYWSPSGFGLQNKHINLMDLNRMGLACRKGRGADQKWFLNPYLFFAVALEMSPKLYAKVIMWVEDGLLDMRNEAGRSYVRMSSMLYSIVDDKDNFKDYISNVAKGINFVVFNEHEDGRRNRASKEELDMVVEIERKIAYGVELGAFKTYDDVMKELRKMWTKRWGNPINKLMK